MTGSNEQRAIESNEEFEVGSFQPEDAAGIVNLFREVYGEGYPIRIFYDEKALTQANADGTYYSIVGRTMSGSIIGVQHVFRSAPYERLYEVGAGLVLKDFRRLGVNRRMLDFVYETWAPTRPGIEEMFGEPVCNHIFMQKTVEEFRFQETALEVALMPAEAYDKERSAAGRVAGLLVFRCYRPKPHAVYLPGQYVQEVQFLYSHLEDRRTFEVADRPLPKNLVSQAEMSIFDFAKVVRIAVHRIGEDLDACLGKLEDKALAQNAVVFQVWLMLGDPAVGAAVEVLRRKGYFLGGPLPRWFDQDGLLMQKLLVPPDFEDIQLYSDRAKEILAIVRTDWERSVSAAAPSGRGERTSQRAGIYE